MSRRNPKRPLYLSYRVVQIPKDTADCQDAFSPRKVFSQRRITTHKFFAIADGVSQSYNAGSFANTVLSSFNKYGFDIWEKLSQTGKLWMEKERIGILHDSSLTPFMQSLHLKRLAEVGAASTLTVLRISPSGHFSVAGVGDSCMFLFRNRHLIYQIPAILKFDFTPDQVSSLSPYLHPGAIHKAEGKLRRGDVIVLMTDAIGEWAIKDSKRFQRLQHSSESDLIALVRSEQEAHRMKVDDVTYMEIRIL